MALVLRDARSEPDPGSLYPWHHLISPLMILGMCSIFCSSEAYSSRAGPSIHNPKLARGILVPILFISSARILFSSKLSPPPPYSLGHVGAVQPFSPNLFNQSS